jgi:hypothetical protein
MSHASAPRAPYRDSAASIRTGRPPRLPALGALGLLTLALGLAIAGAEPGVGHYGVRPATAAQAEGRRPADLRGLADEAPLVQPAAEIGGRIRSVAPVGSVAWLAQGRRVWAVDLADPEQRRHLSSLRTRVPRPIEVLYATSGGPQPLLARRTVAARIRGRCGREAHCHRTMSRFGSAWMTLQGCHADSPSLQLAPVEQFDELVLCRWRGPRVGPTADGPRRSARGA